MDLEGQGGQALSGRSNAPKGQISTLKSSEILHTYPSCAINMSMMCSMNSGLEVPVKGDITPRKEAAPVGKLGAGWGKARLEDK